MIHDLWTPLPFDRDLARRYDRPGPRYTSYPTAPHFEEGFQASHYAGLLGRSAERGGPLSLYVHVPFCERRCFFCGCNVVIARDHQRGARYLAHVEAEAAMVAHELGADDREIVQIHWGGGTPTFLRAAELTELMAILRRSFRVAEGCEIGVEIDPRSCSPEQLDALAASGVNRISLGVQDLDPEVQAAVNRLQPGELSREVIAGARRRGIASVNVDLIYGLPHQSPARFGRTLDEVLSWAPDRLAVFSFAYLPTQIRHQQAIDPRALPDAETKLELLEMAIDRLTTAGYIFIGMDHFARPEDPLAQALRERTLTRNFQGYSTFAGTDLVALGVSAISQVGDGYAQNHRELADYASAIGHGRFATARGLVLGREDLLRRDVILRLMCHFRLVKSELEARHDIDFDRHFGAELASLQPLADDGLLELRDDSLEITPRGRLVVRNVAMAFDAYLGAAAGIAYSRTV